MSETTDTNERAKVTVLDPARFAITLPRLVALVAIATPIVLFANNHSNKLDQLVEEMRAIRSDLAHIQRNVPEVYDLEVWRRELQAAFPDKAIPQFHTRNGR